MKIFFEKYPEFNSEQLIHVPSDWSQHNTILDQIDDLKEDIDGLNYWYNTIDLTELDNPGRRYQTKDLQYSQDMEEEDKVKQFCELNFHANKLQDYMVML